MAAYAIVGQYPNITKGWLQQVTRAVLGLLAAAMFDWNWVYADLRSEHTEYE